MTDPLDSAADALASLIRTVERADIGGLEHRVDCDVGPQRHGVRWIVCRGDGTDPFNVPLAHLQDRACGPDCPLGKVAALERAIRDEVARLDADARAAHAARMTEMRRKADEAQRLAAEQRAQCAAQRAAEDAAARAQEQARRALDAMFRDDPADDADDADDVFDCDDAVPVRAASGPRSWEAAAMEWLRIADRHGGSVRAYWMRGPKTEHGWYKAAQRCRDEAGAVGAPYQALDFGWGLAVPVEAVAQAGADAGIPTPAAPVPQAAPSAAPATRNPSLLDAVIAATVAAPKSAPVAPPAVATPQPPETPKAPPLSRRFSRLEIEP